MNTIGMPGFGQDQAVAPGWRWLSVRWGSRPRGAVTEGTSSWAELVAR